MTSQRSTGVLLLTVLLAIPATAGLAQQTRIGVAMSIRPNAEGVVGGRAQALAAGSELYANQTVRTGNLGTANLVFVDNTNLTVGPTSEVRLDKFVYDPVGSAGKVVLKIGRGAFRFATGTQASRAYQVDTPYGTLGVRGTVVELVIASEAERRRRPAYVARIRLVEGTEVTFTTFTGQVARLTEPNQVAYITLAGNVVYSTSSDSILGFSVAQQGELPGIFTPPPGPTPLPADVVSPTMPGGSNGSPGRLRAR